MKLITFAFVLQFIIACWPKTDINPGVSTTPEFVTSSEILVKF